MLHPTISKRIQCRAYRLLSREWMVASDKDHEEVKMGGSGRRRASPGPRNAWNAQLDAEEHDLPTQAGEVDSGLEDGLGGGDKGRDTETGSGGYSGDAATMGLEEAG